MRPRLFKIASPILFALQPETAHELTLRALEFGADRLFSECEDACLHSEIWGLSFPNPVGVAAGFDKNARVMGDLLGLGCGFAEIGTVTPRPQPGNPHPRIFRLREDQAVINRLGFNNEGHAAAKKRLLKWHRGMRSRSQTTGIVGVNIGANKDQTDRAADYVAGLHAFNDIAAYFTINISSPNTPGLRDLQAPEELDALLSRVNDVRDELQRAGGARRPIIVKISPDIAEEDIAPIVERLFAHKVDGIAVSNTTLARPSLTSSHRDENGGLSGRPLFQRSTVLLARVYLASGGRIPIIGIGGIDSGAAALEKIKAGASLVQLYTALIYEGPGLINQIKRHLIQACHDAGVKQIDALTGSDAQVWAARDLER